MKIKSLIIGTLLCSSISLSAQPVSNNYTFKIDHFAKRKSSIRLRYSDSLWINFDYDYLNDSITIENSARIFKSKVLNANNVFGSAGFMAVPKKYLKGVSKIYFNRTLIAVIRIKRKYSSVHLVFNREDKLFTWRYNKYRFAYL
jgi:hypothetical protein